MIEIIPAILTDNPVVLQTQLSNLIGHTSWVHFDIIDDTLVPGKTVPIHLLGAVPKELSLEVHLMVAQPERYFELCAIIGAKRVIVHTAAVNDMAALQTLAQKHGFELVVAVDPAEKVEDVMLTLAQAKTVQLMSVTPGAQGQAFIPETLDRIRMLHAALPKTEIAIDGGITLANVSEVVAAGAQRLVVGSAIIGGDDPATALQAFQGKATALEAA